MAYVAWTDEIGSASLSNGKPGPARRFTGYVADIDRVRDTRAALGTGQSHEFVYRKDYTAKLVIDKIPVSSKLLMLRFKDYAMQGCEFYLHTEDAADRVHVVRVRPGTEIEFAQDDAAMLEERLTMQVISAEDPQEPLLCIYRA